MSIVKDELVFTPAGFPTEAGDMLIMIRRTERAIKPSLIVVPIGWVLDKVVAGGLGTILESVCTEALAVKKATQGPTAYAFGSDAVALAGAVDVSLYLRNVSAEPMVFPGCKLVGFAIS